MKRIFAGPVAAVPNIELYSKAFCPYCVRAKLLLEHKGVEFQEYSVDFGGEKKREMVERALGRMTVPQIFINGRHIGGCDDLVRLDRNGELDDLLGT